MHRDEGRRVVNDRRRRALREEVKKLNKLIIAKEGKEATALMPRVSKVIDKATKGGVLKKNTANRTKSRLSARIKKIG